MRFGFSRQHAARDRIWLYWAHSITSVALQIPLLAWGGSWLDDRCMTFPVFLLLGVLMGMLSGIWSLYRLVRFSDRIDESQSITERKQ